MIVFGLAGILSWSLLVVFYRGKPPIQYMGLLLFVIGASYGSISLAYSHAKEAGNPRYVVITTSVMNTFSMAGSAVIPMVAGTVIDSCSYINNPQIVYMRAFMVCLTSVVIGYLAVMLLKEKNHIFVN